MNSEAEELRRRKPEEEEVNQDGRDEDEIDSAEQPVASNSTEKKKKSIITRVISGFAILFAFIGIVYLGHYPVITLITAIQIGLFYELLNVRYKEAVEKEIPHFRTLHWIIFMTAMFMVFGEQASVAMMYYIPHFEYVVKYHSFISVILYSTLFVILVLSLKKGYLKYQIGQIAWTMLTIIIVVYQVRAVVPMVMDGLIWMVLPCMTVAFNDTMAYLFGMCFGRKFFNYPLTPLSPNKSWEGFIGGGIASIVIGEILAYFFKVPHLYCPFNQPNCPVPSYYTLHHYDFPAWLVMLTGKNGIDMDPIYVHEFVLAVFAAVVAPFGGFFASAIKRAYGKKDFNHLIPGHGGLMDRFDCQFIMLYFTSMYYKTFIREKTVTLGAIMATVAQLSLEDKKVLLDEIQRSIAFNQ